MKIYLDNNLGVSNVEQEELTQDTIGYNILKVYIPNAVLTPYDTFTCYYGALLQNGRKVGWFAMEARTSSDADYEAKYTLYKATLEQCVVSVEGKVYIGCQVLLGNSGNATLIKKNTAVVQFNVRKSVAINNDILVLDTDQTTTDVLESYKNLLEKALTTYATKATTYTKTEVNSALALKADKSDTYTKAQVDNMVDGLYVYKMYGNINMSVSNYNGELVLDTNVKNRYVDPTWYHLQVGDKIVFNGNTNYRYWLAIKDKLSDSTILESGWKQETYVANAEVYVRITLAKTDNSNISIDFLELLGEDVITIHTRKPVTVRIGTVYGTNLNSYLYYSGDDTFDHRLRTSVIKFNKGDIINFKEFGTKYEWDFMAWDLDGTFISETLWKDGNVYVVQQDCQAIIIFKKSDYAQSLLLKGNIYYQKGLDGATNTATCVIVLDNKCVKTGDTITITNNTNAIDFKVDFLSDQWGQGTTTLQTIAYGTTSATVTADMDSVKNVVITIKKSDGTAFSNISSELLWYIYRTSNITKSNGEYFDTEAIYDVDFEVNGEVEPTKFNSNLVQIGHRGWDEYAPENTIPSFDLAYKLGCRFLEGDIRFTFDGVPVMLHDVTLNRTARNEDGTELSSTINIANITYAQALEYDFGIYQGDLYQGTKIPTFDEMIKWLKLHNDVYFQIDLTTGSWSNSQVLALYKIVAKYGMFDNLIWESGSSATISYLISLGVKPKNTMVSYYSSITTANVDTAYNLGCKVFSIQYSLATYSLIQYVISKGMKPYIWFDSADKYAYNVYRLTNLGVVGFYNTNISDIYALRWFKTLIGYDDNSQSAVTNKEEELLQQAYSDISDLLSDVSTLEQDNANLKMEVANLKSVQNVVEVVATKSALNSYDTTKLDANDKVQVIADETHDGASTIYNWSGSAWQYVGAFGGNSYTKAETYNKTQIDSATLNLAGQIAGARVELNNRINTTNNTLVETNAKVASLETDVDTLQNNTYSKTEVDEKIDDISAYTKSEIDTMINAKADKTTVEGINTRVGALETDIADLKSVQNVVEVVATYSALQSYDTSKLDVNDKVQVIADETHSGASTIYNWSGNSWQYVGAFGGNSYTKAETYNKTQIDSALSDKADKSNTYTRAVIDSMVLTLSTDKADKSDVYTKFEEAGQMFEIVGNEVLKKANAEYISKGTTLTQTSYSNTNPSKSGKVKLYKLGGMSYKVNDTIQNSAVTQIRSMNGSTIVDSLSIPSYIRNIDGYGWGINDTCYNYIDFENKKFVQKVGTRAYQSGDESDTSVITDGTTTYYELATPIETDISEYLTTDTLECIEGGTLEFLNTYNQAVPNVVAYLFNAVTLNNIVDSNGNTNVIATKQELNEKSTVIPNPTLAGTEADLTGLEVDGTKYKVPSGGGGGKLYHHHILVVNSSLRSLTLNVVSSSNTPHTYSTLLEYIKNITNNANTPADGYNCIARYDGKYGYCCIALKKIYAMNDATPESWLTYPEDANVIDTITEV